MLATRADCRCASRDVVGIQRLNASVRLPWLPRESNSRILQIESLTRWTYFQGFTFIQGSDPSELDTCTLDNEHMDEIVKQAMQKWPNVPHCHGWLGLDARGNWFLRDAQAQAQGTFQSGVADAKGTMLKHDKLIDFVQRNYQADERGQWYFQNGPQRVYVELEVTPWIWRVTQDDQICSHTGLATQLHEVLMDEAGWVYLVTALGVGLVHTQDVLAVSELIEQQNLHPRAIFANNLPERYGFVLSPQAALKS